MCVLINQHCVCEYVCVCVCVCAGRVICCQAVEAGWLFPSISALTKLIVSADMYRHLQCKLPLLAQSTIAYPLQNVTVFNEFAAFQNHVLCVCVCVCVSNQIVFVAPHCELEALAGSHGFTPSTVHKLTER